MILRAARALVIGDVMTDVVVRPEGPVARGSDRRASITLQPGGSAANQAAWLASFAVPPRRRQVLSSRVGKSRRLPARPAGGAIGRGRRSAT